MYLYKNLNRGSKIGAKIEFYPGFLSKIQNSLVWVFIFNFDVKRTCTTGKCRDPTLRGDVERHRVCDKRIIKVAEPSPAVTVLNLSIVFPSSSWSRRTNPNLWEDDTTLTAYLPPSGCRIVQRNRWPPNHPVVGITITLPQCWFSCKSLNPSRCIIPRWWPISQLRRLLPWRMTLCISKVRRQGKSARSNCLRPCYDDSVRQLQESVMATTDLTHRRSWYVSQ